MRFEILSKTLEKIDIFDACPTLPAHIRSKIHTLMCNAIARRERETERERERERAVEREREREREREIEIEKRYYHWKKGFPSHPRSNEG